MNFTCETRRYFWGDLGKDVNFYIGGIEAKNGAIKFPKSHYDNKGKINVETWDDCQAILDILKGFGMNAEFKANKLHHKMLYGVKHKTAEITDKDWEAMSVFMLNPDSFDKNEFRIYDSWLAHNFIDRDRERFSLPVLRSFKKTIVGKGQLFGHQWGPPGEGRFFKARLEKLTADEASEIVGNHPDPKFKKHLQKIEELDGAIYFLVPTFYMLGDNVEIIRKIDAGIISDMSIGFVAPARVDIKDENGEVMWREYQNANGQEAEAYEGSFVFLGAQYGARTRKDANGKEAFLCECIQCGYKMESDEHCNTLTCPECGGQMRRAERPGQGQDGATSETEDKATWTTAYINTLEDNCFAVVEDTGKKDDEGRTIPKTARHLPHHAKGNGASGTGGTVDLPHLRNALARMNQIKPVTDTITTEKLRAKAKEHLIAHAKKLGIGNWDNVQTGVNKMKKFKIESLDVDVSISSDNMENSLDELQEVIENKITAMQNELSDAKAAQEKLTAVKEVLGNDFTIDEVREMKQRAEAYVDGLVNETVKYGRLAGLIEKDDEEARKEALAKLPIEEVKARLSEYRKLYDERTEPNSVLPDVKAENGETTSVSDKAFIEPIW